MKSRSVIKLTGLLSALFFCSPAGAASWALCTGGLFLPERPAAEQSGDEPGFTLATSDDADLVDDGTSVLIGNVQIIKDGRQLQADRVEYTRPERVIDAEGNIRMWDDGIYVGGDRAHVEMEAETATLEGAEYILLDEHAHGEAERVVLSSLDLVSAEQATYTTCDPTDPVWMLTADEIELDRVEEWGNARNVLVTFKGAPIFYSPYLSFPLSDKRKTGFLAPSYRISDETGFEVRVPFYWNIAPERDATLTARTMTDRGVQMQGEYRFISDTTKGRIGAEYLPEDDKTDEYRAAFSLDHEAEFGRGWSSEVEFDWVSDEEYFEDLGTTLAVSSQRFLDRRGDLRYQRNRWSLLGRLQDYQTVDRSIAPRRRPYKRLPQLRASYDGLETNRTLVPGLYAEAVHFDHDDRVTGTRLDLKPSISYPMRNPWSFVVPKASLEYTAYDLDDQVAGLDDNPDRLLPIFSTDAGLFFERPFSFRDNGFIQTLEPRLFYLFVPHEGQDDQPDFDTGSNTFSFAQLFRENRFNGADRVGDANQLTLALTSRLLSSGGKEWLRASIGQIVYFRDREVQLNPATPADTDDFSDFVGELSTRIGDDLRLTTAFQWDHDEGQTNRNTARLRYQPDAERIFNAEYRFVRDEVEQTDFSMRWPLNPHWSMVGRWNYSLPDSRTLGAVGGVEYNSCCVATRLVFRRYINDVEGSYDNAVFFQFELKGLAGIGDADEFIEKTIPGYKNTF